MGLEYLTGGAKGVEIGCTAECVDLERVTVGVEGRGCSAERVDLECVTGVEGTGCAVERVDLERVTVGVEGRGCAAERVDLERVTVSVEGRGCAVEGVDPERVTVGVEGVTGGVSIAAVAASVAAEAEGLEGVVLAVSGGKSTSKSKDTEVQRVLTGLEIDA